MASMLLDTHAWVWSFAAEKRLSAPAPVAISSADAIHVRPNSFF